MSNEKDRRASQPFVGGPSLDMELMAQWRAQTGESMPRATIIAERERRELDAISLRASSKARAKGTRLRV